MRNILGNEHRASAQEILTALLKQWRQKLGYCSIFAAVPAILASQLQEARSDDATKPEANVAERGARLRERLNISGSNPALLKRQSEYRLPHQKGNLDTLAALAGVDDCPGAVIPGGNYTAANPFVVSGDTTGANDTVNRVFYYYYFYVQNASGPDHVYSFILTSRGANPQIQVSTTSGTYKPLTYLLYDGYPGACPAGTGNTESWLALSNSTSFGGTATINSDQMNSLPLNVPLHLFVDSASNGPSSSGPYSIRIQDVTIAPAACPNAIDCGEFFVRQQYFDFLRREPDAPGIAHWVSEITACNDPSQRQPGESLALCAERKRANTSAAFFLSPEFQNTGSFVLRVYWGTLDKRPNASCAGLPQGTSGQCRPTYNNYVNDMFQVARGIVVNNQLAPDVIDANKRAFVDGFVNRPEFKTIYKDSLSNQQFVEELFTTTGIVATHAEFSALVGGLDNGTETRSSVVFKVVDGTQTGPDGQLVFNTRYGKAFYDQEFDAAFVFMEYVGYMQRNPDQDGYDHWLAKLKLYGNWQDAQMVLAFILSPEYRSRFGQL